MRAVDWFEQDVIPAEIARRYSSLPPNVHVVRHDDPANTYALMDICDAVLIYGTKTGVELAPFGIRAPRHFALLALPRPKGANPDKQTARPAAPPRQAHTAPHP